MRAALGLLAVCLSAQAAFGKIGVRVERVDPVSQVDGSNGELTNVLQEETTAADNVNQEGVVAGVYHRKLQVRSRSRVVPPPVPPTPSPPTRRPPTRRPPKPGPPTPGPPGPPGGAQRSVFSFFGVSVRLGRGSSVFIRCIVTVTQPDGSQNEIEEVVEVGPDGTGELTADVDGTCDGCTVEVEAFECVAGECDGYSEEETNKNLVVSVVGDPHMIGLLGQQIDWVGEDGAWYCLISNGPNFHVNVRLSAPMPVEFPYRQLVSGLNIITDDGRHSLLIEVKDPYTTATEGCPSSTASCLADGGVRIMVDGKESAALQSPAENVLLSEAGAASSEVIVSAANLPAECRPFGGDRIWAAQFAEMMTARRRSLRIGAVSFTEWLLQPETLAAPTWCAQFLQEGGTAGLLATRSEHATFRVETPVAVVRVNVGLNYQDLETAPDGAMVLPELEFWQMDLGFDELQLSDDVTGLLGDTSMFALDDEGVPVTSGLGALHAPVESYRVADAYARDFEKLNGQ